MRVKNMRPYLLTTSILLMTPLVSGDILSRIKTPSAEEHMARVKQSATMPEGKSLQDRAFCRMTLENLFPIHSTDGETNQNPALQNILAQDISATKGTETYHLGVDHRILNILVSREVNGKRQYFFSSSIPQMRLTAEVAGKLDIKTNSVTPFFFGERLFILSENKQTGALSLLELERNGITAIRTNIQNPTNPIDVQNDDSRGNWSWRVAHEGGNESIILAKTIRTKVVSVGNSVNGIRTVDVLTMRRINMNTSRAVTGADGRRTFVSNERAGILSQPIISGLQTIFAAESDHVHSNFILGDQDIRKSTEGDLINTKLIFFLDDQNRLNVYDLGPTFLNLGPIQGVKDFENIDSRLAHTSVFKHAISFLQPGEKVKSFRVFRTALREEIMTEIITDRHSYVFNAMNPYPNVTAQALDGTGIPESQIETVFGSQKFD